MKHIFLTGYRCTGKTSIGRQLADTLGLEFVDADDLLVKNAGKTVAKIVEESGWDHFRDLESRTLQTICEMAPKVVATGGGVILREDNVRLLKDHGTVVWLKASVDTIASRMTGDSKTGEQRPGLTDKGAIAEIAETLKQREPLYSNAMDFSVDTDGAGVDDLCRCIADELK
jgi:shikimate kinase